MKKFFTILTAICALGLFSNQVNAQVEKGTIILEPFYGYSLSGGTMKLINTEGSLNNSFSQLGPMGLRFEFMVSDLIGLGVDAVHKKSEISTEWETYSSTYTNTNTITKTFIMARMNFHFVRTEAVDFYAGYGIGYKMGGYKFESTLEGNTEPEFDVLIPVAFRVSTGVRYFFTENIGAGVELGFGGGSVASASLAFKF